MVFASAYGRGTRTRRVHRPDGAVAEHRVTGADGGYYNEWLDFCATVAARAAGDGERRSVGTVAQSFTNMLVVLRGLDSAEGEGEVDLAPDAPQPLVEHPIPLWRPGPGGDLFDGLPVGVESDAAPRRRVVRPPDHRMRRMRAVLARIRRYARCMRSAPIASPSSGATRTASGGSPSSAARPAPRARRAPA